jgi:hypothetical protein
MRLSLIRHTATLAKSKADAEAEREKQLKEAKARWSYTGQKYRHFEADGVGTNMEVDDTGDDALQFGQYDVTTTIKKFLKYENPFLSSLTTHRYVFGALTTAQICEILPSRFESDQLLSTLDLTPRDLTDSLRQQAAIGQSSNIFDYPKTMSIVQQQQLRDYIKTQLEIQRKKSQLVYSTTNPIMPSSHNILRTFDDDMSNANGQLRYNVHIVEEVCKEFGLEEKQSLCYYFMAHRLLLAKELLPTNAKIEMIKNRRMMYMGGAGGTGKSKVILAIVQLFERLDCRTRLNVAATTGFAAHGIGGSTIDSLCQLMRPRKKKEKSAIESEHQLQTISEDRVIQDSSDRWSHCQFLILDEVWSQMRFGNIDLNRFLCWVQVNSYVYRKNSAKLRTVFNRLGAFLYSSLATSVNSQQYEIDVYIVEPSPSLVADYRNDSSKPDTMKKKVYRYGNW